MQNLKIVFINRPALENRLNNLPNTAIAGREYLRAKLLSMHRSLRKNLEKWNKQQTPGLTVEALVVQMNQQGFCPQLLSPNLEVG